MGAGHVTTPCCPERQKATTEEFSLRQPPAIIRQWPVGLWRYLSVPTAREGSEHVRGACSSSVDFLRADWTRSTSLMMGSLNEGVGVGPASIATATAIAALSYFAWWRWSESMRARSFVRGSSSGGNISSLPSPMPALPRWCGFIGGHTFALKEGQVRCVNIAEFIHLPRERCVSMPS